MENLQPLWASSLLGFFFLQHPVHISFLLHLVALTACPFIMQTTILWITYLYLMFLGEKLGEKKERMNRSDLLPIQKLHDSQNDSYPKHGRVPAQCIYGNLHHIKNCLSVTTYQLSVYQHSTQKEPNTPLS